MSHLNATQIPKPGDPQAFERACVVLWRCLLNDPNVQRNGRSGQRQAGVDIFGVRNSNPHHLVGVQCKLKGAGQKLTEREVRDEFREASTFRPALREFVIASTAPDDAGMQLLARELAVEAHGGGWNVSIQIRGWNTLEERISECPLEHRGRSVVAPPHVASKKAVIRGADDRQGMSSVLARGVRVDVQSWTLAAEGYHPEEVASVLVTDGRILTICQQPSRKRPAKTGD